MPKLEKLTDVNLLQALLKAQNSGQTRPIDVEEMTAALNERVKGQEHVTQEVARFIRQNWAKEKRGKPIATMLFVGKTGTGKTELAKAMAEYLYKDDKNLLKIDCGDFKIVESVQRLIGSPPGYRDSERGGVELTRKVIQNPKRVILFDEIEKACTEVLDLFLPMLDEARLAEAGTGKVADFTQAIIVLTSNLSADAMTKMREEISDPHELNAAIKNELVATGKFRPEIAARINKVFVFKPLEGIVVAGIIGQKMYNVARQFGLELVYIDAHLILKMMQANEKLKDFGMRELEIAIGDMLNEHFIAAKESGCKRIRLDMDEDGGTLTTEVE